MVFYQLSALSHLRGSEEPAYFFFFPPKLFESDLTILCKVALDTVSQ